MPSDTRLAQARIVYPDYGLAFGTLPDGRHGLFWLDHCDPASVEAAARAPHEHLTPSINPEKETTMAQLIDFASHDRSADEAARHQDRQPSQAEKAQMVAIEEMGAAFIAKCHEIGGTDPKGDRLASFDLALAVAHIEYAVMRAIRPVKR